MTSSSPRQIDYYFSLSSPWSYLGHPEFMRIAAGQGVKVAYKPAALAAVFEATGGLVLSKRHPARQDYRLVELQRWREKRGVPMHMHPKFWPLDPALADRTIVALVLSGAPVESVLPQFFTGVFENERNLADPATIAELLAEAGLDAEKMLALAQSPAAAAAYERNTADAVAAGVVGAPSYVLDGEPFWGQDRLELLEDALKSGRAAYSPVV
jgi:2-hydroxychromene-2-carboxylate isomerase